MNSSTTFNTSSHGSTNSFNNLSHDQPNIVQSLLPVQFQFPLEVQSELCESESDISHESRAEKKIQKIDKRLKKNKQMDKVEKRRLQNRKSALKCRLRKSHTIASLSKDVAQMKDERQTLHEEVRLFIIDTTRYPNSRTSSRMNNYWLLNSIPELHNNSHRWSSRALRCTTNTRSCPWLRKHSCRLLRQFKLSNRTQVTLTHRSRHLWTTQTKLYISRFTRTNLSNTHQCTTSNTCDITMCLYKRSPTIVVLIERYCCINT